MDDETKNLLKSVEQRSNVIHRLLRDHSLGPTHQVGLLKYFDEQLRGFTDDILSVIANPKASPVPTIIRESESTPESMPYGTKRKRKRVEQVDNWAVSVMKADANSPKPISSIRAVSNHGPISIVDSILHLTASEQAPLSAQEIVKAIQSFRPQTNSMGVFSTLLQLTKAGKIQREGLRGHYQYRSLPIPPLSKAELRAVELRTLRQKHSMKKSKICPKCNGDEMTPACSNCEGNGYLTILSPMPKRDTNGKFLPTAKSRRRKNNHKSNGSPTAATSLAEEST